MKRLKHSLYGTKIYQSWIMMLSRCRNKNGKDYARYGGRGIKVCGGWLDFDRFFEDMGETYKDNLTLDRINTNGNYCKENCRWATRKEQANNRHNTCYLSYLGIKDTLTNWAEYLNLNRNTLATRVYRGWSMEKIINY